jgi:hypothetical protein
MPFFTGAVRAGDFQRSNVTARGDALVEVRSQVKRAPGGQEPGADDRATWLRGLDGRVLTRAADPAGMPARDLRARTQAANLRENREREAVPTRADWEHLREPRVRALRESLGLPPANPEVRKVLVTRTLEGDGFHIENLVFESRPGLVVTANLYVPARPTGSMPGILISHSHHAPKTQGKLQDMGMTRARRGCLFLVPDHLGHCERRQHPFRTEADYARPFRAGRQDYYFCYNTGMQL